VQFDEEPVVIRSKAPGKGEHSDEVLEGLGFGAAERARLRKSGAIG
jgi:crotonobetainyl-CoA:carnitine CoA-transferase CaiB-like acyl-CoA transferase